MKVDELCEEGKKKILELKGQGLSNGTIANQINSEYVFDLNETDIYNFVTKQTKNAVKVMQKKGEFENRMAEQYFNTIEQLKELNSQMWKEFYSLRQSPDYKERIISCEKCNNKIKVRLKSAVDIIKAADHLLKQIEHVDTILGKLRKTSLNMNVNYNIVEMTEKINRIMPNLMEKYERMGAIKIKKKKLIREN